MPTRVRTPGPALLLSLAAIGPLAACSGATSPANPGSAGAPSATVTASDDACEVSPTDLDAGTWTFAITNTGSDVTEVYVYGEGDRIVAEKEDIGPGTSYDMTVELPEGSYQVACKPGMAGDGIRTDITVAGSGSAAGAPHDPVAAAAVADYRAYVQQQADASVGLAQGLRDAVAAGDRAGAQALYAPSRVPWESVEPVAESFGDLDPRMDAREADLVAGEQFTGWHRLEKALWTGEDLAAVVPVADQLVADASELARRVPDAQLTPAGIGNGAKELLDEVATGKVTGEEEAFSHTDLVDFEANVRGAQRAFESLRPLAAASDPELVSTLDSRFAQTLTALDPHRAQTGFASYDTVAEPARRELARVVDGLSEPLSQLAAAAAAPASSAG